jgi:hypothetical protein
MTFLLILPQAPGVQHAGAFCSRPDAPHFAERLRVLSCWWTETECGESSNIALAKLTASKSFNPFAGVVVSVLIPKNS